MPDPIFEDLKLTSIYDDLDPDRSDLDVYSKLISDLGAKSVLDIGCGTGTFACMLAGTGYEVVGLDPSRASLDVARSKPNAEEVQWIHGYATDLAPLRVDVATMTGNVAQVFLSDDDWSSALIHINAALGPGGRLVFEVRDPAKRAWEKWTREHSYERVAIESVGIVETWIDLVEVSGQFVTFRGTYHFERTGEVLVSDSTLRFRERGEVEKSLVDAGYALDEIRDAPDRPGREFVFIASSAR